MKDNDVYWKDLFTDFFLAEVQAVEITLTTKCNKCKYYLEIGKIVKHDEKDHILYPLFSLSHKNKCRGTNIVYTKYTTS